MKLPNHWRLLGDIVPLPTQGPRFAFFFTTIIMLFRLVLRRDWAAMSGFILLFTVFWTVSDIGPGGFVVNALTLTIITNILVRLGVVSLVATFCGQNLRHLEATASLSLGSWTGVPFIIVMMVFWGFGTWAFVTAMAGRKIVSAELLEA